MEHPNDPIPLYEGVFLLQSQTDQREINGALIYKWLPEPSVYYKGTISLDQLPFLLTFEGGQLIIDGITIGNALAPSYHAQKIVDIEGRLMGEIVLGDKSIGVTEAKFSIPNLISFYGKSITTTEGSRTSTSTSRLFFDNDTYKAIVDKVFNYSVRERELSSAGGYLIQYSGSVAKINNGTIFQNELKHFTSSISTFLSFVNGRRTGLCLVQGLHEGEEKWRDCTRNIIDRYKFVKTWTPAYVNGELNVLWKTWSALFNDEGHRDFLVTAVHWYVAANSNSGASEGSIIMVQTALELIYNWLIIEQNKLILGNDAESIAAANKIRLLLSHLKVSTTVPTGLTNLSAYVTANTKEIADAPECFVQIRNAIVHSQEEKRKKLTKIPPLARHEAAQLGLWYVELALLKILGYKSDYVNRCNARSLRDDELSKVPWA